MFKVIYVMTTKQDRIVYGTLLHESFRCTPIGFTLSVIPDISHSCVESRDEISELIFLHGLLVLISAQPSATTYNQNKL